jgi:hypothetical protein
MVMSRAGWQPASQHSLDSGRERGHAQGTKHLHTFLLRPLERER